MQAKLDSYTWKDNSAVIVLVPELEQWLWFCENALATHYAITVKQLAQWVDERAAKLGKASGALKEEQPKELFEHVVRKQIKRTISPRDFEEIGNHAGVNGLLMCPSFSAIVGTLRAWFPPAESA
jgi:hypothetical protein